MKTIRVTCMYCCADLAQHDQRYGLCVQCAERYIRETKKYFRNRLIVGIILAVLFFLIFGRLQLAIDAMTPTLRTLELNAIANTSASGRALWAAIMLTIPFGYFHRVKVKGASINEAARAEMLTRFGSHGFGAASNNNEGAGLFFLIAGVLTAPIVGPVSVVYRIIRVVHLRRLMMRQNTGT